jgi:hypothetical protein
MDRVDRRSDGALPCTVVAQELHLRDIGVAWINPKAAAAG